MNSRMSQADDLREAIGQYIDERIFIQIPHHGNTNWTAYRLAVTALLWSWSPFPALTQRFREARGIAEVLLEIDLPRHWQGFVKKLRADHEQLKKTLIKTLRADSRALFDQFPVVDNRPVLAVDGTRLELPRTEDNQQNYGTMEHADTTASRPTAWLTLVWDVASRTPWDWRLGPTDSSERHDLLEMLDELPERSILTADAGFQGYDLWKQVIEAGHDFVIRVGGQVHLLHEYWTVTLDEDVVYLWPQEAQRKKQPPLKLRLLRVQADEGSMYLVTNVLSSRAMSRSRAAKIYQKRWGVEVFFREHKQTFEKERLRSHASHNVPVELEWSLMALWILKLLGARALQKHGFEVDQLSVSESLRAMREEMVALRPKPVKPLWDRIAAIKDDGYMRRDKRSRNYPRKKKRRKSPGPPKLKVMTGEQRNQLRELSLR